MGDDPIRVLLIEDNPGDARLIQEFLAAVTDIEYKLEWVDRLSWGIERLATERINVILLDLGLPDSQGLDTFLRIQAQAPEVPVLVLSGLGDEAVGVAAVQKGAQDYLVKGQVTSSLVDRAMRYAMERRRLVDAIRTSHEYYRTLIESTSDIVAVLSGHGILRNANASLERVLGCPWAEMAGKSIFDFIHPDDVSDFKAAFALLVQNPGGVATLETRLGQKGGEWRHLEVVAKNLLRAFAVAGVVLDARDITERKRAEKEVKLRAYLLDAASEAITLHDLGMKLIYANEAAWKVRGYTREELMALDHRMALTPENAALKEPLLSELEEKGALVFESAVTRKDGSALPAEVHASLIQVGGDRYVLSVISDITRRKAAEQRIAQHVRELQRILAGTVKAISKMVEMRDPYTAGHEQRVADLAKAIAERVGLSEQEIEGITIAGLLHDIGKISVPAEILSKPGRVSENELRLIQTHSKVGFDILSTIEFPWPGERK